MRMWSTRRVVAYASAVLYIKRYEMGVSRCQGPSIEPGFIGFRGGNENKLARSEVH